MMTSDQLRRYLLTDASTLQHYGGVITRDELAFQNLKGPRYYVVNTDVSTGYGKHWTVIFLPKDGPAEFYDSLGHHPRLYSRDIERFLTAYGCGYVFNCKRLQNYNSTTCGKFCLFFISKRCKGVAFADVIQGFGDDLNVNEHKVKSYTHI